MARRVVKGGLSPSTTTSSAGIELDYDGYDLDGVRSDRWSSGGCGGGLSWDASSQRPQQLAARSCGARWSPQVVDGAEMAVAHAAGGSDSMICCRRAVQSRVSIRAIARAGQCCIGSV